MKSKRILGLMIMVLSALISPKLSFSQTEMIRGETTLVDEITIKDSTAVLCVDQKVRLAPVMSGAQSKNAYTLIPSSVEGHVEKEYVNDVVLSGITSKMSGGKIKEVRLTQNRSVKYFLLKHEGVSLKFHPKRVTYRLPGEKKVSGKFYVLKYNTRKRIYEDDTTGIKYNVLSERRIIELRQPVTVIQSK